VARGGKAPFVIGVDIGGTKILSAVVDGANTVRGRGKRATPFKAGQAALTEEVHASIKEALAEANLDVSEIKAIGVGAPGPLDPPAGILLRTPNIAVKAYPIGPLLKEHYKVPVVLDNDVHMACYGEFKAGAARGRRDVVGLWIGTGVGGCVIVNGRVVIGANRNAGEIGHIILDASKRKKDPRRGSLELESSKTAIQNLLAKWIKEGKKTSLRKSAGGNTDRLKSADLATAFEKGDKLAVRAVEHSAWYLGIAVANLFDILSPELFVLGGGVAESLGEAYLRLVKEAANEYVYTTELAPIALCLAQLGGDAGVVGAAILARETLLRT
jgi:glucokinase